MGDSNIEQPFIFAVCGRKNSGKTTLVVELVKFFKTKKLKVAVIKHDGHDFSCDHEGTDSHKVSNAGADSVAVYSKNRVFIHEITKEKEDEKLKKLINHFKDYDLVIVEGAKSSDYCKIELLGRERENTPVSNPIGRCFLVSDYPEIEYGEKVVSSRETDKILATIYEVYTKKEKSNV